MLYSKRIIMRIESTNPDEVNDWINKFEESSYVKDKSLKIDQRSGMLNPHMKMWYAEATVEYPVTNDIKDENYG